MVFPLVSADTTGLDTIMTLTDLGIRRAKLAPGKKQQKITDSAGLHLLLTQAGGKLWRYSYRHGGKQKLLAIGAFPDVGLKEARDARDAARKLLTSGTDPGEARKLAKVASAEASANTFGAIADELLAKKAKEGRATKTMEKVTWLIGLTRPALGARPIASITVREILDLLRTIEARGQLQTAKRLKGIIGEVFRFGMATDRCTSDPTQALRGALTAPTETHHAALTKPEDIGGLLRAIDSYRGAIETRVALQIIALCFPRPSELRTCEWSEVDMDAALWTIPAHKAKQRREHVIPLSRQAVDLFRLLKSVSGPGKFAFQSMRPGGRAMSENTMNGALRRLGYSGNEHVRHGFRGTASTRLNAARRWHPDLIEEALSHADKDKVRAAYNRADNLEERAKMMQAWADMLDEYRVLPIK